jgi:hypothetical protein
MFLHTRGQSRDSSVDIVMGFRVDKRGSIPSRSNNNFFLLDSVQAGSEAHPISNGYRGLNQPGREAHNSP